MGIWFMMLGFNLLIPAILLSAGKLFLKKAPKDINWIFGYRSAMSMKNGDSSFSLLDHSISQGDHAFRDDITQAGNRIRTNAYIFVDTHYDILYNYCQKGG